MSENRVKSQPVRPSFGEAFRLAADQVGLEEIEERFRPQARELCFIMAEAMIMPTGSVIAIGDEALPAELVQGVFRELTEVHLMMVIDAFNSESRLIRKKRPYLRTCLYNSVFELECGLRNRLASEEADG